MGGRGGDRIGRWRGTKSRPGHNEVPFSNVFVLEEKHCNPKSPFSNVFLLEEKHCNPSQKRQAGCGLWAVGCGLGLWAGAAG